jgi:hypothetical protein
MIKRAVIISFCLLGVISQAQVGIGTTTPDTSSALDILSTNSGLLIPRVNLVDVTNNVTPITAPATSLLVWNTNAAVIGGNGVGYYYWDNLSWTPLLGGRNTLDEGYDQGGLGAGRIINATDGPLEISGASFASGIQNSGALEIENSLRLDGSQIITNTGQELFLQFGNNADFSVDDTTLFIDSNNDRVGIGTFQPDYRLHVATGRAEISEANEATGTINSGVLEIANSLRLDGNEIITNTNTTLYLQNANNGDLDVDENTLYVDSSTNNVGIGTASPSDKLVVTGGRVEITSQIEATNLSGTGSLEIGNGLRIDNNEITSGNTLYLQEDGSASLDISNGDVFVNGSSGFTGIGTITPSKRLHVRHNNSSASGFGISNINGAGGLWHFHVRSNVGQRLELHFNNNYRGNFDAASGFYTSVSDRNLKREISNIEPVLKKIKKLNIVDYLFINQETDRKYVGLIAQEVEKIFPHLVYGESQIKNAEGSNYYTMDYTGFGVIAIKAIQEQQATIEDLQNQVNAQNEQIEALSINNALLIEKDVIQDKSIEALITRLNLLESKSSN